MGSEMCIRDSPDGDPELRSAMALGVVMQTAEYSLYGRIKLPLSQHVETFVRSIMAVLRTA